MSRRLLLAIVLLLVCAAPATAAPWPKRAGIPAGMDRTYKDAGQRFGVNPRPATWSRCGG